MERWGGHCFDGSWRAVFVQYRRKPLDDVVISALYRGLPHECLFRIDCLNACDIKRLGEHPMFMLV
jgi:hypothetical protein